VNVALVAGCGAAGLVAGAFLDSLTGRIVRPPEPPPTDRPTGPGHPRSPHAYEAGAATPVQVIVAPRGAGTIELIGSGIVTGAAFALLAIRLGAVPPLAAYCALVLGLVAISVVDVRLGIVPRAVLYPTFGAMAVGLVSASAADGRWRALGEAGIGGAGAFAVFFALWWFFPRGLGYGDIRLAGVVGAALGWIGFWEIYVGFLVAFALGAALGVMLMVGRGTGRKTKLAFGPPLAAGAAFGVLWGPWAVHVWLHHG
jgi:leader peptidase (prepilin peptidase)/N-methyltransferase